MKRIEVLIIFFIFFQANNAKGQSWSPVGTGLNNIVFSLVADTINNLLYAGGTFRYLDVNSQDSMAYIAKWDGVSWSEVGTQNKLDGIFNGVRSLFIFNNDLYAGGEINYKWSQSVAKWDGMNWAEMGWGFTGSLFYGAPIVLDFAVYNNNIIAGGSFRYISDSLPANWDTTNCIAGWEGSKWDSLGSGVYYDDIFTFTISIEALAVYNGELYAGGFFDRAGGNPASSIAKWNDTTWTDVGYWGWPIPYCFNVYNGKLFFGGLGSEILSWDGFNWDTIATIWGSNAQIHALAVYNNELIAGGFFDSINGMSANNIAKWDGTNWTPLGSGTSQIFGNGTVEALAVLNGELYAGGWFDAAGGIPASYIAKWGGCGTNVNFSQNADTVDLVVSGDVSFTNQSVSTDSLLWDFGDGTNDTAQNPIHTFDSVGIYTVTLTGFKDSCSNSVSSTVVVIYSTNIEDDFINQFGEVNINPNPFTNTTTIEIINASNVISFSFTIYDNLGRSVKEIREVRNKKLEINRQGLSDGIYFYRIKDNKGNFINGKIVIQ